MPYFDCLPLLRGDDSSVHLGLCLVLWQESTIGSKVSWVTQRAVYSEEKNCAEVR